MEMLLMCGYMVSNGLEYKVGLISHTFNVQNAVRDITV